MSNTISAPGATGPMFLELLDGDGPSGVVRGDYTINGVLPATTVNDVGAVIGTSFDDTFVYKANAASDGFSLTSLDGGLGSDTLRVLDGHLFDLAYVTGVETFESSGGGLILNDANFTGVASNQIKVKLDATLAGTTTNLDASSFQAGHSLYVQFTQVSGGSVTVTGGAGDDIFEGDFLRTQYNVMHGGQGMDQLFLTATRATVLPFLADGFEYISFSNFGSTSLQLTDANFVDVAGGRISVAMGGSAGTVDGSALNSSHALFLGTNALNSSLIGGAADDVFSSPSNNTFIGGGGVDTLLTGGGLMSHSTGVEYVVVTVPGAGLTITDNAFTDVSGYLGGRLINGGTIDVSAAVAGHNAFLIASLGNDTLTGGAGDDVFQIETATLSMFDVIKGGAGNDTLLMTQADVVNVTGVSGVEFYRLGDGAVNSLTLSNANMVGVGQAFGVQGGADGNTIDASAIVGKSMSLYGGAGVDSLRGGGAADVLAGFGGFDTLFGGGGADAFAVAPGGAHIQDFVSGQDLIFFSDALFDLGSLEGTGASVHFDRLDPSLFSSTGAFTTPDQRFAFDAVTHDLYYGAAGSLTAPSSVVLLAHLDNGAVIGVNDLYFGA
ncbi:MAG TPA: calcium-binding protein [Caulobacter sp.]|nr:calcium-binding protein [Caulobacter sp.]